MSQPRQIRHAWIPKTLVLVLVVALGWGGWYFYRRGFTREWRNFLVHELREQGIEVTVNRMTLDPFRGLIVHGVVIYDSPERRWVLAELDRATLDVSIPAMLREKPFINGIDFRDAVIVVPIDSREKSAGEIRITKCWAKLYFLVGSVALRRAEGEVEGVRFAVSGTAIIGDRIDIGDEPPLADLRNLTEETLALVRELKWKGDAAPQLSVEFSCSADEPDEAFVDASFHGNNLSWRSIKADSIEVKAKIEGNHLLLDRAQWIQDSAELRLQGSCNMAAGTAWFHLESELPPAGILGALREDFPAVQVLKFASPPRFTAEGELWHSEEHGIDWRIIGEFDAPHAGMRSVQLEKLKGSFAWERNRWFLKNVEFENGPGSVRGDALFEAGIFKLRAESEIDPRILSPFLNKELADSLNAWSFSRPPSIELSSVVDEASGEVNFLGEARFGRCEYQGQTYRSAHTKFQISQNKIKYDEMELD